MAKRASTQTPDAEFKSMSALHKQLAALPKPAQLRAIAWICDALDLPHPLSEKNGHSAAVPASNGGGSMEALRQVLAQKKPITNADRVAVLAWFATNHMGMQTFRTRDISRLNAAVGQPPFSNAAVAVKMARLKGWLQQRAGQLALTDLGVQFVDRLPDPDIGLAKPLPPRGGRPPKKKI